MNATQLDREWMAESIARFDKRYEQDDENFQINGIVLAVTTEEQQLLDTIGHSVKFAYVDLCIVARVGTDMVVRPCGCRSLSHRMVQCQQCKEAM